MYVRQDGLSGIVVCDQEYPPRVAFALMNKMLEEYNKENTERHKERNRRIIDT